MPWSVRRDGRCPPSHPWAIIKKSDKSKVACHATQSSANKQLAALYAAEGMTMADPVMEFLSHHGVKGMRWGVRRKSGGSGGSSSRTTFKKSPKKLSDVELNKRIKRMETEKKYNQLNKKDLSEGRKFAKEILTDSGKRVAKTVATGAALVAIKAALTSKFGPDVAEAVTRRLK